MVGSIYHRTVRLLTQRIVKYLTVYNNTVYQLCVAGLRRDLVLLVTGAQGDVVSARVPAGECQVVRNIFN